MAGHISGGLTAPNLAVVRAGGSVVPSSSAARARRTLPRWAVWE